MLSNNIKKSNLFLSVLITILLTVLLTSMVYFKLNVLGDTVNVPDLGVKLAERIIDNNQDFWLEYKTQNVSFKYPMYLSSFNDISATELTAKDERVANYFRSSDENSGNGSGRSYWIILMSKDPYLNTQGLDIQKWIKDNKLNIKNKDCITCSDKDEIPIKKISLRNRDAYSISLLDEKTLLPRSQRIYFQTKDGIASIGFFSYSIDYLDHDYKVFNDILSTLIFID